MTWEQVTTNVNVYSSGVPTNKAPNSGNGYGFSSAWRDKYTFIETSGNFTIEI